MADLDSFADFLIAPSLLKRFVAANRWSMVDDRPREWEVWRSPVDLTSQTVTLLFDTDYVDYERRTAEANETLTRAYGITLTELMERITALSADLFFFRIEQDSRDGTIPFKQAQRALESIATMVRAAATTVANPSHSHRGRRPGEVDHFISEDLRLGHTKRGSFVVTAAARLDNEPTPSASDNAASEREGGDSGADQAKGEPSTDVAILPFGRRVMTTFSRGLEAARDLAIEAKAVSDAIEQGLSLELAEALEKISSEEGLQTIEVTFDWSDAVPVRPRELPDVVTFERLVLDSMPRVTEQLQTREVPRKVTLSGLVRALARNVADEEAAESGEVTLLTEVDGRIRNVLVQLDGIAHQYAIRAYRDRFPIIVSGDLVKRRSWQLEGDISMDTEAAELMTSRTRAVTSDNTASEPPIQTD